MEQPKKNKTNNLKSKISNIVIALLLGYIAYKTVGLDYGLVENNLVLTFSLK